MFEGTQWLPSRGPAAFLMHSTSVMIRFALIKGKHMQSSLCLQDFTSKHEACYLAVGPKRGQLGIRLAARPCSSRGFPTGKSLRSARFQRPICWTRWCTGESSITLEMGGHHHKVPSSAANDHCQWGSGKSLVEVTVPHGRSLPRRSGGSPVCSISSRPTFRRIP